MTEGKLLSASTNDTYVVKLVGDVRVPLVAKLCIRAKSLCSVLPVIYTPNTDMTRLLNSMGFENIAIMSSTQPFDSADLTPIECESTCCDNETAKNHVLEAHRTLMTLCDGNEAKFADLVAQLEAEIE